MEVIASHFLNIKQAYKPDSVLSYHLSRLNITI